MSTVKLKGNIMKYIKRLCLVIVALILLSFTVFGQESQPPFTHTACPAGVDLTGQTIQMHHIIDPYNEPQVVYRPFMAGAADAAEYFNAQGGICGATIEPIFDDSGDDEGYVIYDRFRAMDPKPLVITLATSTNSVALAPLLAEDQIPAITYLGGALAAAYGEDGQTRGWVFLTNPLYVDQAASMCDYIAANPDQFPEPVIGFIGGDNPVWRSINTPELRSYCADLGIGYAGVSYFDGSSTFIEPQIQTLINGGANIIYLGWSEDRATLVARTLMDMALTDQVRLVSINRALDPGTALIGDSDLDADGLPAINGMIGSLPVRSWAETDQPSIQLITEQADLNERPLTTRTDAYIMAWKTTDLFIETYIQSGIRVGFEAVTGADIKTTLETLVYAPLGGIEQIDFTGDRRSTTANRIGIVQYLGEDGVNPATADNPPMRVTVDGVEHMIPIILPLTDFAPGPEIRPMVVTETPTESTETLLIDGRLAIWTARDGNDEVYLMNVDGSDLINLTNYPEFDGLPDWSPDGTKVAFVSYRNDNVDIYVMNADGSDVTRLTDVEGEDGTPFWSPDGTKIVFTSARDGNAEIYVMDADGGNQTRLTDNPSTDELPSWSPDGTRIVFSSNRDGNGEIYVMNADGSNEVNITNHPGTDFYASWSPDGTRIAFGSDRDSSDLDIFVMDADGGNPIRLTETNRWEGEPAWSPDGTQIAFTSERDGNGEVYLMNADGSNETNLTNNPANDWWPRWMP